MTLKNIVYLTKTQYETLVSDGSITIGGVTYTYDENNDYRIKYNPLPECSTTTNGTFYLQGVVSNGTITYSWVSLPAASGNAF